VMKTVFLGLYQVGYQLPSSYLYPGSKSQRWISGPLLSGVMCIFANYSCTTIGKLQVLGENPSMKSGNGRH